ncbi:MAG: ABC transporter ATP-binding protein, partial [Gammaproteobacteria bacterium]|nr:ABC transporter ATP-binding protein [Gammaproteobacteria bacterium]
LHNVGVSYTRRSGMLRGQKFWALHDVSFDLHQGETLGVIGHNGAGKSTMLRLLAGIMAPDRGQVVSRTEKVSLLSLSAGLVPHLTGRENAVLSGILMGLSRQEVLNRMQDIIEFSELGEFIDEAVRTYSSGMRARLGFAVAFQADPDVLLVDEILGVGDTGFKEKSTQAMKQKIASDKTVVIVTHNPDSIAEICKRMVWIHNGLTHAIGKPDEILRKYQESFGHGATRGIRAGETRKLRVI